MFEFISQDKIMNHGQLYTRPMCSWCIEAKEYLRQQGIPFDEIDVGRDKVAYAEMVRLSGQRYVPTFVMGEHVLADFDVRQLQGFLARLNARPSS